MAQQTLNPIEQVNFAELVIASQLARFKRLVSEGHIPATWSYDEIRMWLIDDAKRTGLVSDVPRGTKIKYKRNCRAMPMN